MNILYFVYILYNNLISTQSAYYTKLEKADILEQTVKYLEVKILNLF